MQTKDDAIEVGGRRHFAVIAVSLGIALLPTSVVIDAFTRGRVTEPFRGAMTSEGPVGDGSIYFRAENDQGEGLSGIVEADGTGQHEAFPGDRGTQFEQVAFSPDRTRIAYVDSREDRRGIYVANTDGTNAVRLTDEVNDSWPDWSPDGAKIAFVGTRFDPAIAFCHPGVYADCLTDIYTMDADGSQITDVTGDSGSEFDPAWSPDGSRIAFALTPDTAVPTAIAVMDADGSDRMTVSSSNGGSDFDPRWSPDGAKIVFGGIHREDWGLFEVRPDGSDERTLLFGVGTYAVDPSWSPDGSRIAFGGNVGDDGGNRSIYTMEPDGSGIRKLVDLPEGWGIREVVWLPMSTPCGSILLGAEARRGV